MSNLINHAWDEFQAAGWCDKDHKFEEEMQAAICENILALLTIFSEQGHSGTSAQYAIEVFSKLASFEPLVPIQGGDDEWIEYEEGYFQNIRCSHVFKNSSRFNGQAYDSEGRIFYDWSEDEDGKRSKQYYTCKDSAVPIRFPYTPSKVYQERTEST